MLVKVGPIHTKDGIDDETYWKGPLEVEWSLNFPIGEEPVPSIVKAIRGFYPAYVPLWCTRVFLHPDGRTKLPFNYHVIGAWREHPYEQTPDLHRIVRVDRPHDFPFKGGVIYQQRTVSAQWPDGTKERAVYTPDMPLPGPTTWAFKEWMESMWKEARGGIQRLDQIVAAAEAKEKAKEQHAIQSAEDDADANFKSDYWRFRRAVDEGRIFDNPVEYQPKSYAFLGSGAR